MRDMTQGKGQAELLTALVGRLAPHIRDSSVPRSVLEHALVALRCSAAARAAAMEALDAARITVVEDLPDGWRAEVTEPVPDAARPSRQPHEPSDPLTAGRRRLAADDLVCPSRLQNILLTAEEEVGLTLLARPDGEPLEPGQLASLEGEPRVAAEALVLHNLRLAHSMCQGYVGQGLDYEDLFHSAVLGLLRAVELFDPAAGFKFSTYASWWLRQAITRAIANEGRTVRLPVHMWELVRRVVMARDRMTVDGKPPSRRDLAAECEITEDKVAECLLLAPGTISLDTPLGAGEDAFTLGDLVDAQEDVPEHIEVHGLFPEDVEEALQRLEPREAEVLRMRYGLDPYDEAHTLDEIGKVYGVTRERIRQIQTKAMESVRAVLAARGHYFPGLDLAAAQRRMRRNSRKAAQADRPDLARSA